MKAKRVYQPYISGSMFVGSIRQPRTGFYISNRENFTDYGCKVRGWGYLVSIGLTVDASQSSLLTYGTIRPNIGCTKLSASATSPASEVMDPVSPALRDTDYGLSWIV